jgi:hypothetical protein
VAQEVLRASKAFLEAKEGSKECQVTLGSQKISSKCLALEMEAILSVSLEVVPREDSKICSMASTSSNDAMLY